MNMAILITVMFTIALVLIPEGVGAYGNIPCTTRRNNNAYNNFVHKHILQGSFNTASKSEWQTYISNMRLCDRPFQSFIRSSDQNRVEQICNGSGKRWSGNLCFSTSSMLVYDVTVRTWDCTVSRVVSGTKYVYVACDNVANQCRPVHYEKSTNQPPTSNEICGPLA